MTLEKFGQYDKTVTGCILIYSILSLYLLSLTYKISGIKYLQTP